MDLRQRCERVARAGLDPRSLRLALLAEMRTTVPFDAFVWVGTDPETCVGCDPLADVPARDRLPQLICAKYLTTRHRWTTLERGVVVGTSPGEGAPDSPLLDMVRSYGITDVASCVIADSSGCWGFLDLWRRGSSFDARELAALGAVLDVVASAVRRSLVHTFSPDPNAPTSAGGPVVLLLSDELDVVTHTPATDTLLRALLPTDPSSSPVPAVAYNVAAQLLAVERGVDLHRAQARVAAGYGRWVSVRAARLESDPAAAPIAVTIEPATPAERASVYARVLGLTRREVVVLRLVVAGTSTRELADQLAVSEHTVQDHLKAIFAKAGVRSRRALVARATGSEADA